MKTTKTFLAGRVSELEGQLKQVKLDKDLLVAQVRTDVAILCQSSHQPIQAIAMEGAKLLLKVSPEPSMNVASLGVVRWSL